MRDGLSGSFSVRDKSVVYPAMHWCLERLPQLKKRAYLARYLMPVEVPVDFMQDQALIDLHESYKEMQVNRVFFFFPAFVRWAQNNR